MAIGTVVLLIDYLVVFISVPIVEVAFMRHTTVTSRRSPRSQAVGFQVLATLSTIGSFVGDTGGVINRDWYITGGFMLVNGSDGRTLAVSSVIIGSWGLSLQAGPPRLRARRAAVRDGNPNANQTLTLTPTLTPHPTLTLTLTLTLTRTAATRATARACTSSTGCRW